MIHNGVTVPSLTEDGKSYVYATPRPAGTLTYFTGRFDAPTAVGKGDRIFIKPAGATSASVEGKFNETIFMNGMFVFWKNGDEGVEVTYEIKTEATQLGAGPGPYNLAGPMVVPAAGPTAGDYTLVEGGSVPVPVSDMSNPNGFFDIMVGGEKISKHKLSWKDIHKDTAEIVTNGQPTGLWNLYAVDLTLARFGNLIGLEGDGQEKYAAYDVEPILPQWTHVVHLENPNGLTGVSVKLTALTFRKNTT